MSRNVAPDCGLVLIDASHVVPLRTWKWRPSVSFGNCIRKLCFRVCLFRGGVHWCYCRVFLFTGSILVLFHLPSYPLNQLLPLQVPCVLTKNPFLVTFLKIKLNAHLQPFSHPFTPLHHHFCLLIHSVSFCSSMSEIPVFKKSHCVKCTKIKAENELIVFSVIMSA